MGSGKLLLIDNDAFLLLAGAGLLDDAITFAGFTRDQARRLPALEFMLKKRARVLAHYPETVLQRAAEACALVQPMTERPSLDLQARLSATPKVDDGEAVLYGVTAENDFHVLSSNDKNAMTAVATTPALKLIRKQVAGRILCMEVLLRHFIDTHGPMETARRFEPLMKTEKRIHSILSPALSGRPQDCEQAVNSFLKKLTQELGSDFLFIP